uniref:Ovule protein n=1 Tax=Strongyloides venezuelensis TaxID=75913 RepID=A0A0K0ETZ0_STRVS
LPCFFIKIYTHFLQNVHTLLKRHYLYIFLKVNSYITIILWLFSKIRLYFFSKSTIQKK